MLMAVCPPGWPPVRRKRRGAPRSQAGNDGMNETAPAPPLRILIVEDDAMIGMLLGEMLEAMGYSVCSIATTEDEAVRDALALAPELMIVDIQLRKGGGASAVATISQSRDIPCVFVSGDTSDSSGAPAGAVMLAKPYDEAGLTAAMARVLKLAVS